MEGQVQHRNEYEKQMNSRILGIEADIGAFLRDNNGREPQCIIIGGQTIYELLSHLKIDDIVDWKNPEGVAVELGGFPLRIFRTTDLKYGQYFIL